MPRPGSGNSLTYGKIVLVSESEDMVSLVATLGKILDKHSYPEAEKVEKKGPDEVKKNMEDFQKELEKTRQDRDWTGSQSQV